MGVPKVLFILLFLALVGVSSDCQAETVVVRGRRGVIVRNNGRLSSGAPAVRSIRGAPNLVLFNGKLFERDLSSRRLRRIGINIRNGQLVGARNPDTARQLSQILGRNRNRFSGRARRAVEMFLAANPPAIGQPRFPTGGRVRQPGSPRTGGRVENPGRVGGLPQDGRHGNGSPSTSEPQPRSGGVQRPVAKGAEPTSVPDSVCSDLNSAICNDPNRQNRERQIEDFKRRTVLGFLGASRLGAGGLGQLFGGILNNPGRFAGLYRAFLSFITGRMSSDVRNALGQAKSRLLQAVEKSPFSEGNKGAIRGVLGNVKFRVTPNFGDFNSLRAFVENCGPDGMAPGAFALPDLREVVICPGLVFGAQASPGSLTSHLLHVIAHEMGHNCGADHDQFGRPGPFKPLYQTMEQCYLTGFTGLGPARMGEVAADTWGAEALAMEVKGKSRQEAFNIIRNAVSPLCGSPASPVHPPGNFRINVILGRNPDIAEALQCNPPSSGRPYCGFDGRVTDGE